MGSAALWSSLQQKYFSIFGHWSGSVGGLFENNQEHHLKGCSLLLRWLQGKKILEEKIDVVDKKFSRPTKNKILLSLTIKKSPKNRLASPKRTGEIFLSPSRMSIQDLFTQYQLCGIRLKNWLLSRQNPGRMIQLGTGSCRDLLILHQGLNERVKKISGKTIALSLSPFGKEQPHARAKK